MPPTAMSASEALNLPRPTKLFRIVHVDNLSTLLRRRGLHAPNHQPDAGLPYRVIHNEEIQRVRRQRRIPCGLRGVIHDYVSFYFGPRLLMLYLLHTCWARHCSNLCFQTDTGSPTYGVVRIAEGLRQGRLGSRLRGHLERHP